MNEVWIYHIAAANVDSSSAGGLETSANRPKRRRLQQPNSTHHQTDDKVLATIFWNASGVISIDYLDVGVNKLTVDHFIALLNRLDDELHKKRPHLTKQTALFHYDTISALASTQISSAAASEIMAKLKESKNQTQWELC